MLRRTQAILTRHHLLNHHHPSNTQKTRKHTYTHSELHQQAGGFVLRRTQAILTKHLPPLQTFTMFVRPSELQVGVAGFVRVSVLGGA